MLTPEVIKVFSGLWWFGIIASIIISILIIQLAIRIPPDRRDMLMTFIGIFLLLLESFRHYHLLKMDFGLFLNRYPYIFVVLLEY